LVEDNPEVQEVAGMLLEQLGYQVFHAESATVALQFLASGEAVDLVFTDIVMPGGSAPSRAGSSNSVSGSSSAANPKLSGAVMSRGPLS